MYIFFRQIYKMWVECGLYPELSVEDVKDEVFDMAQPKYPLHITTHDLQVTICIVCADSHGRSCSRVQVPSMLLDRALPAS